MNAKPDAGDTNTRKRYIRSIVDAVEVNDQAIRIIGSKDILQVAIAANRPRTQMFVVLYANGAPRRMKMGTYMSLFLLSNFDWESTHAIMNGVAPYEL
ncbi:hypothetical protein XH92_36720 [Bradyrhizobium sp. CCBAU 53421]|nr:hypothetical protein XH92_36720 [Bradyrhizobium sp. CCBAU 53421]